MRPKITKTLKGALGETYYKELCAQKGWAYCSLETIHNCKDLGSVIFKMGFNRIRVNIPGSIRPEIIRISKPSNRDAQNPSFVFDYLACRAGYSSTANILHPKKDEFCWAEIKTGLGIFSGNQYKTLSEILLPIAVFHIEDIMAKPQYIDMDWDIMSGRKFVRILEDDDSGDDYNNTDTYDNHGKNHNSRRGIVAKFGGQCRTCGKRISAGKDRVRQNSYGSWVHAWCA